MTAFLFFSPPSAPPQLEPVISHPFHEEVCSLQALGGWKCPGKGRHWLTLSQQGTGITSQANLGMLLLESGKHWSAELQLNVFDSCCHQIYPPWEYIQPGKLHPTFG